MPVYFEGKRKKVRYGRDLVEVRFGKKTKKEAFAVFSADDGSLNFYKRVDVPKVGEQFEGKTVAAVYTGIEKSKFTNINEVPWVKEYQSITKCIVVDEIKPMSTAFWFALTYMTVCDVSKLDTTSTYDMWNMFMGALRLYELKLGKNFTWQGERCYPPIQTAGFVPNADGKWYAASDGKGYAPSEIPSNKADTYYAYPPTETWNTITRTGVPAMGTSSDIFVSPSKTTKYRATLDTTSSAQGRGMSVYIYNANSGSMISNVQLSITGARTQYFELNQGNYKINAFFDCHNGYPSTLILEEKIGFEFAPIN